MKILAFAVNNFRGISGGLDNNRILFDESNTIFIFGKNNVGKSTYLLAYQFLYLNSSASQNDFYKKDDSNEIQFELAVKIDDIDIQYIEKAQKNKIESFKKYISTDGVLKIRRQISASDLNNKFKIDAPRDSTYNPSTNVWDTTAFGTIGLSTVFQYLLPTPIHIKAMPTEAEVEKVINEILASKAKKRLSEEQFSALTEAQKKVKELQEHMYSSVSIERYKDQVNFHYAHLFPGITIDFLDTDKVKWTEDKFGKKFEVQFKQKDDDENIDTSVPTSYSSIGHGAVRSAIFALLLMRDVAEELERTNDRKEFLILFEEPELFLHPKLMRELRNLIYMVSDSDYPYQILCASHSPQMIDISKSNSSLVRMVKFESTTKLLQITDSYLLEAKEVNTKKQLRHELFEVLRFNPHICESFYADEVILTEGQTEEVIIRGILQNEKTRKDLFVVNCNSVNNIPFYQKVYSKFSIKHHVICDTDDQTAIGVDQNNNEIFEHGIQGSISKLFRESKSSGLFRTHKKTFEPAHRDKGITNTLRLPKSYAESDGKPFNANRYWKEIISPSYESTEILTVPIVKNMKDIVNFSWS